MVSEIIMPQMGADMKEGILVRWLKGEGDEVTRGDVIAEIETDKANVEVEAFESGTFRKAIAQKGDTVPVGEVIAVIAGPDEDISKYEGKASAQAEAPAVTARAETASVEGRERRATPDADVADAPTPAGSPGSGPERRPVRTNGRIRVSPVARRLADEAGIDLAGVQGTGPDGRIVKRDIEAARSVKRPTPAAGTLAISEDTVEDVALSRTRAIIARRMQQAKQTAPHYYLMDEVDMTEAMRLREEVNRALDELARISVNDVIVYATAKALTRHSRFNAHWLEDHLQLHSNVNVGIAVALDDGLVAPAIIDCARKGLSQIAEEARDLAERARGGSLSQEEYAAATFTVSNLGPFDLGVLVPIINPPQVAILGVGTVREKPVVRDGSVVARQMMAVVLAADHRATDGAEGARFLATVRQFLEVPGLLLT